MINLTALGRELTNRLRLTQAKMSAPGPKAAFVRVPCHVAFGPCADNAARINTAPFRLVDSDLA